MILTAYQPLITSDEWEIAAFYNKKRSIDHTINHFERQTQPISLETLNSIIWRCRMAKHMQREGFNLQAKHTKDLDAKINDVETFFDKIALNWRQSHEQQLATLEPNTINRFDILTTDIYQATIQRQSAINTTSQKRAAPPIDNTVTHKKQR